MKILALMLSGGVKMVDAGKLRHRLVILSADLEQDSDTGEMIPAWTELATVWGAFEPYSTRERLAAASAKDESSARAIIRYRDDVAAEMRISFREKLYEIVGSPLPDAESGLEHLTLMLREIESTDEEVL